MNSLKLNDTINKYLILDAPKSGCFGSVYKVRDRSVDADRALKVIEISGSDFSMLISEAKALERCRHKHIVCLWDANVYKINGSNCLCLSMEYLKNGSIGSYLDNCFVTLKRSFQIIRDILYGLAHAHQSGILHRDIKPSNIMIDDCGCYKLSDFGLAMDLFTQSCIPENYRTHMAPELLGGGVPSIQSDVYSTGVTLYRIVNNTNRLDIPPGKNLFDLIKKGAFPNRSNYQPYVPRRIRLIVNKAMNIDPINRYHDCEELLDALNTIRFGIEWSPNLSIDSWKGTDGNIIYSLEIESSQRSHKVVFRCNGRRYNRNCHSFLSKIEAQSKLMEIIKETSLK